MVCVFQFSLLIQDNFRCVQSQLDPHVHIRVLPNACGSNLAAVKLYRLKSGVYVMDWLFINMLNDKTLNYAFFNLSNIGVD